MTEKQNEFKQQSPNQDLEKWEGRHPVVQQDETPNAAIMLALQKGTDPTIIEKLMDLAERQEANIARKAYVKAMAQFKVNPPKIMKDKSVSFGANKTAYSHASLANVTNLINSALSENGLSASWQTKQDDKLISITCTITHEMGHSAETTLTAAPDSSGSKNSIQAIGSTISYLERYTLLALTGLATHDMDDDGQSSSVKAVEFITEAQQKTLTNRIQKIYGDDPSMFFEWIGCKTVDTITDFAKAKRGLDGAEKAMAKSKVEREPGSDDK